MKKLMLLTLLLFIGVTTLLGEETNTRNNNIDKPKGTDEKIDVIYDTQQTMYKETRNNPLEGKKYGIEFNIFRVLLDDDFSLSGGFSIFDTERKTEISVPLYYFKPDEKYATEIFTMDCHYRYFLRNTLNGFYLSAFGRLANFKGYRDTWWDDEKFEDEYEKKSFTDIGVGVGVGYRIFSYKGLYWGTSISFGRYLLGNDIEELEFDNNDLFIIADKQIINIEFLKFGWAF